MKVIDDFRGQNFFLSNFYECPVPYDGIVYSSVEAGFQAAKVFDKDVRKQMSTMSPSDAKRMGRHVPLRKDWESVKVGIMEDLVRSKFDNNPDLADRLLKTGSVELVEGNTWGDRFWGVDVRSGRGRNMLGQTLMKVRSDIAKARGVSLGDEVVEFGE